MVSITLALWRPKGMKARPGQVADHKAGSSKLYTVMVVVLSLPHGDDFALGLDVVSDAAFVFRWASAIRTRPAA